MESLSRAATSNGNGLYKATLDRALDRLIETMDGVRSRPRCTIGQSQRRI